MRRIAFPLQENRTVSLLLCLSILLATIHNGEYFPTELVFGEVVSCLRVDGGGRDVRQLNSRLTYNFPQVEKQTTNRHYEFIL